MNKAMKLIRIHGTNDPIRIASERKTVILYENLGKNIWGYFTCTNRIPAIHVNERLYDFPKRFTIAHELIHSIEHRNINTPFLKKKTLFSVEKIEREANHVAIHLLVGENEPEYGETKQHFLERCGIPQEYHIFY